MEQYFPNYIEVLEIKKIADKIKALIIEILCQAIFLFLIITKPTKSKTAVLPLITAWRKGKDLRSAPPNSKRIESGNNIRAVTARGITIDKTTISGIKNLSLLFTFIFL